VPPTVDPEVGEIPVTVGAAAGAVYVNLSLALVALVPPGVVTVTSTVPATSAGEVQVISVALTTLTFMAVLMPKSTSVDPVKFEPVIVTPVPPTVGPEVGEI
jgi:hypothetical protein